uniref:PLAC8-domain-containing protein n=1 Tax=Mycena chlorophos TaxID=658473 RepID=A0ABQ0LNG1_MYCCL|nr:predicted protein [Mycena chlorophos]
MSGQGDCCDLFCSCCFCCSMCGCGGSGTNTRPSCIMALIDLFPDSWCVRLKLADSDPAGYNAERDREAELWQGDQAGAGAQQPAATPQMRSSMEKKTSGEGAAATGSPPVRNIRDKAMIMGDD